MMSAATASMKKFALVLWTEEGLHSVISLSNIVEPKAASYEVEDLVRAKFKGRVYPAQILGIGGR